MTPPTTPDSAAPAKNFEPVRTLEELDALDDAELRAGYREYERGDPEPGVNRGKAYWHGWCNGARDHYQLPYCPIHAALVHDWCARERQRNAA